jgi:hypothetical protein
MRLRLAFLVTLLLLLVAASAPAETLQQVIEGAKKAPLPSLARFAANIRLSATSIIIDSLY